jgi:Histidine kinase-, DNA gyrase B-, and HSP90-like ATPase
VKDTEVAPDPQLMESMRAVGYTLETAIADIIDNSITAGGDQVDVRFTATPEPRIAIIDNGSGMDQETLIQAMRLAGRPPSYGRQPHDLGRFGLGLKTASLSQARSLTVVTKQDSPLRGVRWDLDHLATTAKWSLQLLDEDEIRSLPWIEYLDLHASGTLVLWQRLDQLHTVPALAEEHLDELMKHVRNHLGLVFHRFTNSALPPLERALQLRINGAEVPRIDPFLTQHRGTQRGQLERIEVGDSVVTVQPYTLPYISKLRASDREAAQVAGTLRDSQGFYIYRAGRLVLWGTWFRIISRDELGKLARAQVDIPNALDHLWALDIKKSSASPPPEVRRRLAQIAGQIVRPSRRVHQYRGRPIAADKVDRFWSLIEDRDTFRYEINREHPLVVAFSESLDGRGRSALTHFLRAIEATFPVEDAYNRLGSDRSHTPTAVEPAELAELARALYESMGESVEIAAQRLALIEPFSGIRDLESFLGEVVGA